VTIVSSIEMVLMRSIELHKATVKFELADTYIINNRSVRHLLGTFTVAIIQHMPLAELYDQIT
jgi:uncharacterized membrane protein